MVKSEKKLLILETILSFLFLLNIFVKNVLNDYLTFFIILLAIVFVIWQNGYEKDKKIDDSKRKKITMYVCFYCVAFIVLQYGLGFALGYIKTPYKRDLLSIFHNVFSTVLIIISSEYLRYMIIRKGEKKRIIHIFSVILFILIDLSLNVRVYNLFQLRDSLEFITSIFLPSFFKNIVLTIFIYRYGVQQNILYRLILELYVYILPFIPDMGIYLESILLMIFPMLLNLLITYGFEKEKKKDFRDKGYGSKITTAIIILLMILVVALNSDLFRYRMVVVASGSMIPTIDIGDMIIIDKDYQKHLDKLKIGDILVFKMNQKIYTHRITDIRNEEKYYIKTKGDREGQLEDSWTVTNEDVVGVVKLKIRYIGYPTVWLSRILEGNNG